MFKVSCIQLCSSDNVEYNLKKTKKLIIRAVKQKTNFILTPEVSSKVSLDKKRLIKSATSMDKDFYLNGIKITGIALILIAVIFSQITTIYGKKKYG